MSQIKAWMLNYKTKQKKKTHKKETMKTLNQTKT
jgi:hypothetical protein